MFSFLDTLGLDSLAIQYTDPQVIEIGEHEIVVPFDHISSPDLAYKLSFSLANADSLAKKLYLFTGKNQEVILSYEGIVKKGGKYIANKDLAIQDVFYFISFTIPAHSTINFNVEIKNSTGFLNDRSLLKKSTQKPEWKELAIFNETEYLRKVGEINSKDWPYMNLLNVFIGALGFTSIFVFLLFLLNKQKAFLYYGCYLFSYFLFGIFHTRAYTIIGQKIGDFPVFQQMLPESLIWLGMFFYGYFSIHLLQIKKHNYPKIRKYIIFISWFSLLAGMIIGIINLAANNLYWNKEMVEWIRLIYSPLGFIGIVLFIWKVRSPLTVFLAVGVSIWAILGNYSSAFALGLGYELTAVGLGNNKALLWLCIGLLLESIMFAFALGKKIKITEDERLVNQEALIKYKEEENVRLEQLVNQKTNELLAVNNLVEEQKKLEVKQAYEKRIALSEMSALRSQMNPHFIFNSLNSIRHLVLTDQKKKSATYLSKFAKLLRQILEFSRENKVTINGEIENIRIYLELESERFDDSFRFEINTSDFETYELEELEVPPLLLQPFVENAIIHGLRNSPNPVKELKLSISRTDRGICIEIADNGIGRVAAGKLRKHNQQSLGTQITQERIQIFNETYDTNIEVMYVDSAEGTTVRLFVLN